MKKVAIIGIGITPFKAIVLFCN